MAIGSKRPLKSATASDEESGSSPNTFTRGDIEQPILEARQKSAQVHNRTAAAAKHHNFLSHSHRDGDLILSAVAWLGKYSDLIYVDWKDESIPTVTSPRTALLLKHKIAETKKFILLATQNSLNSKWVPWELGVADKTIGYPNVAVLPVADYYCNWPGSEYIGIYSWIRPANNRTTGRNGPAVFEPGKDTGGVWLDEWLEN